MHKITQIYRSNQLREENNELQQGIEYQLEAINESLKELIEIMKG